MLINVGNFYKGIGSGETPYPIRQIKVQTMIDECESFRDKLLFCLCNAHKLEEKPEQFEGKQFERLFEIARISNFSAEELSEYEASRMNMLDYNASMKFARKEGIALGEARVLDLVARGYGLEQIKEILKDKK